MRRLLHIAGKVVVCKCGAADGRNADGGADDIQLLQNLGNQLMHDAVRAARAKMLFHIGQPFGALIDDCHNCLHSFQRALCRLHQLHRRGERSAACAEEGDRFAAGERNLHIVDHLPHAHLRADNRLHTRAVGAGIQRLFRIRPERDRPEHPRLHARFAEFEHRRLTDPRRCAIGHEQHLRVVGPVFFILNFV
ncbi:hypothetical protein SDC9_195042 [bioreactor metagenome]|uniref:Uncharacterized protein n=1 Tax=bioreactor metagenome TaxID=1076179 RepID=A0A645I8I7_9ZZZZ